MMISVISNIDEENKIIGKVSVTGYQTYLAVFMKEALSEMILVGVFFVGDLLG